MKQVRATLTRLADGSINAEQRKTYEQQYNLLAGQIASFIDDSLYNGRTLLSTNSTANGGDITAIRNETGGTFTIQAVDGQTLKLPTAAPTSAIDAQSWVQTGGNFDSRDQAISSSLNKFGTSMSFLDNQIGYNTKKVDAMSGGLGALIDADLAKESSSLEALRVRQQLGVQTLSLANQGPQVLLGLFRS
jgi:flagellin